MPGSGSMAVGYAMYKQLPYDPIKDFAPMALIGRVPFVLIANKDLAIKTVPDLIAYAKANKIFYASGGPGSPHHIYAEMFKGMTGIEMTHVPYKGSADAIKDVVAGHVQVMFSDLVPSLPLVASGTVRALGVTLLTRWPTAPDIPPLNEAGVPGFDASGWFMISGPAGTPKPIVERLHADLKAIMSMDDVQQAFNRVGVVPVVSPPLAELPKFIATETGALGQGREAGRARRDAVGAGSNCRTCSTCLGLILRALAKRVRLEGWAASLGRPRPFETRLRALLRVRAGRAPLG